MFKSILSVLGGIALGVFTISIVQFLGQLLYPMPATVNPEDPQALASYITNAPVGALLLVLLAYAIGAFLGGNLAARYAPAKPVIHALIVGTVLLIFGIVNFWQFEHPLWFVVVAVLLFVPMSFFGGNMSARRIP
ncbi:hypothetical protein [Rufibacter roseus]|uniref:Major facilitator superfamily (MFS) profile domain-containing protein n=1 Tax=Rufibacter roseus TaxID=1567108 RepID=A0ABW2DNP8_9BACT|nr:hypothetical protein [Rufibacter roseus]